MALSSAHLKYSVVMSVLPNKQTIGPDIVVHPKGIRPGAYYIIFFGELKDAELTARFYRELEAYAVSIFKAQPLRPFIYSFLASDASIIFFKFFRPLPQQRPRYLRSPVLDIIGMVFCLPS